MNNTEKNINVKRIAGLLINESLTLPEALKCLESCQAFLLRNFPIDHDYDEPLPIDMLYELRQNKTIQYVCDVKLSPAQMQKEAMKNFNSLLY